MAKRKKQQSALEKAREAFQNFIRRMFPPELVAYIPGQKLIAGAILYALAEAVGFDATVIDLPVVGEVNTQELALLVGAFFWPTNAPVTELKAAVRDPDKPPKPGQSAS